MNTSPWFPSLSHIRLLTRPGVTPAVIHNLVRLINCWGSKAHLAAMWKEFQPSLLVNVKLAPCLTRFSMTPLLDLVQASIKGVLKYHTRSSQSLIMTRGAEMKRCSVAQLTFQPFHSQVWSIWNFPCSLTRNMTSHSMKKNLAFHSLTRWKMIMLQFSLPVTYT